MYTSGVPRGQVRRGSVVNASCNRSVVGLILGYTEVVYKLSLPLLLERGGIATRWIVASLT